MHYVYTVHGHLGAIWHARSTSGEELAWAADAVDAKGRLTREVYGNGLMGLYEYNLQSDRLQEIRIGTAPNGEPVGEAVSQMYGYDNLGRLTNKSDNQAILVSPSAPTAFSYGYDALDRLTSVNRVTQTYEANGNLKTRGNTTYTYGDAAKPHAVTSFQGSIGRADVPGYSASTSYTYDANGNMLTGGGRSYTWTAFDQPNTITHQGALTTSYLYDDAQSRVKETTGGTVTVTINPRLDLGHGFQRVIAPTQTTDTIYVSAMGRPVASIVTTAGAAGTSRSTRWLHADALGSVVAVTDGTGQAVARYAYDAWGLRLSWVAANGSGERRGYTGHETLEGMGLVNMNGRLYDPALARFVSADPFVPNPDDWQSYNRYSYVLNNPLGYTDPSGYFHLGTFLKQVASVAVAFYAPGITNAIWSSFGVAGMGATGASLTFSAAIAQGATSGFIIGGIQGGTLKSALNGAFGGGLSGGLFYGAGQISDAFAFSEAESSLGRALFHGTAGCVNAAANGGKCGNGFVSAGFTQFVSTNVMTDAKGIAVAAKFAIIGGTASVLSGGKFANGAVTGTFQYLFNFLHHATFDRATGVLDVQDGDKRATGMYFSGSGPDDQISPGAYAILDRGGRDGFRLEAIDSNFGDDRNASGQVLLRLHGPGRSIGCITACDGSNWEQVRKVIQKTEPREVLVNSYKTYAPGGHLIFRIETGVEKVKFYGILRVK